MKYQEPRREDYDSEEEYETAMDFFEYYEAVREAASTGN